MDCGPFADFQLPRANPPEADVCLGPLEPLRPITVAHANPAPIPPRALRAKVEIHPSHTALVLNEPDAGYRHAG